MKPEKRIYYIYRRIITDAQVFLVKCYREFHLALNIITWKIPTIHSPSVKVIKMFLSKNNMVFSVCMWLQNQNYKSLLITG